MQNGLKKASFHSVTSARSLLNSPDGRLQEYKLGGEGMN